MSDTAQNNPSTPAPTLRRRARGFAVRVLERLAADEVRDVVGGIFETVTGGDD